MNAGELRAMLELIPDDTPVLIHSGIGLCHVDKVSKEGLGVRIEGDISWQAPAPEVTRRGRWPNKPPAKKKPVDPEKVAAGLVSILKGAPS